MCVARLLQPRGLIVSRRRGLATAVIWRTGVMGRRAVAITAVGSLRAVGRGIGFTEIGLGPCCSRRPAVTAVSTVGITVWVRLREITANVRVGAARAAAAARGTARFVHAAIMVKGWCDEMVRRRRRSRRTMSAARRRGMTLGRRRDVKRPIVMRARAPKRAVCLMRMSSYACASRARSFGNAAVLPRDSAPASCSRPSARKSPTRSSGLCPCLERRLRVVSDAGATSNHPIQKWGARVAQCIMLGWPVAFRQARHQCSNIARRSISRNPRLSCVRARPRPNRGSCPGKQVNLPSSSRRRPACGRDSPGGACSR